MFKKLLSTVFAACLGLVLAAQTPTGGVKGTVLNRADKTPVQGVSMTLFHGAQLISEGKSAEDGSFMIGNLADGDYTLVISDPDFIETSVNITVSNGTVRNMFNLSLSPARRVAEIDDSYFADFDMNDSGYQDNPTILFNSNDVFTNLTSYNFSAVRFRNRGYSSESQDVYLAGVRMNDALTGYGPFSLWSGLNEATRNKVTTIGLESSRYALGGYNGVTNINATPSSMRTGFRGSVLTNSALYRLRLALSYASGELDNGWSYAFNVSARLGENDWINGVYYKSLSYYAGVEKKFNDAHRLALAIMAAPGERGAQNSSTQEVYDLMGDNLYNSNWGYQGGRKRNARLKKSHEPIVFMKYDFTPSDKFQASATLLYRFGWNGSTALDWYDAADPRPDYYRNLPSYFYSDIEDLDRVEKQKYYWATESWQNRLKNVVHVDWDRLYSVNRANVNEYGFKRSKYVQEERRVDQRDLNFAANAQWKPLNFLTLNGGLRAKLNNTEYYKKIADLLGGDFFVDIDNFAERDYASSQAKVQNNLDYYLKAGAAPVLNKGDKYGYDYYAHLRNAGAWLNTSLALGDFSASVGGSVEYETFWREGMVRKGLFPGLDASGKEIVVDGVTLTNYDSDGRLITSLGDSRHLSFLNYSVKGAVNYVIGSRMRVYGNVAFMTESPKFNMAFIAPRTRNSVVKDLDVTKIFSADLNYQYSYKGYSLRLTGYYTKIDDQTDVMSFYDDSQSAFTNFAMSNIDERHVGIELGFKVPTPVQNLSLQGAFAWGENVYTSTPFMTQTVDNSATVVIDHQQVPYWKSHPVFKRDNQGALTYEIDHFQKHYVPSTPQIAATLGLNYNYKYWFIDLDANFFDKAYLDMNPLYRTDMATAGPDKIVTPVEVEYMAAQEKFNSAFLMNASVGKSWFINNHQLGFSLQVRNLLNNRGVRTGGYEQTRLIDKTKSSERYYKFDSKYFYMTGINYMLNIYYKF